MTFGVNPRIPGQILSDPGEVQSGEALQELLQQVRSNVLKPAEQPSNHRGPEKVLPTIPEGAKQAYVRQHKRTGLQAPFEGPFDIEERLSRSTVKLHVGNLKDGTKKFEIRHVNDLKFTHPDSLASSIHRPSRGRPAHRSAQADLSPSTELNQDGDGKMTPSNRFRPLPKPTSPSDQAAGAAENKQDGTDNRATHATSNRGRRDPTSDADSEWKPAGGPPPAPPFTRRSTRSTRNPNPAYVGAIWVASQSEIDQLNRAISGS